MRRPLRRSSPRPAAGDGPAAGKPGDGTALSRAVVRALGAVFRLRGASWRARAAQGGLLCGAAAVVIAAVPGAGLLSGAPASRGTAVSRSGALSQRNAVAWGGVSQGMASPDPALTSPAPAGAPGATTAAFRQIVLPDLVVVEPHGLSQAQVVRLGKLPGVRKVLAVDGASITTAGHPVNVIGVNPQLFRSWTPLRTASDSQLWSALDARRFLVSQALRDQLHLRPGAAYPLTGSATQTLAFGGSGQFGVAGIDVVVNNSASAGLGLIHNVAALVSAPGAAMGKLMRETRALAGAGATLTDVRPQQLPVDQAAAGVRPSTYLDLFKQSAAEYCPGLSWTVLAAIGQIESGDGANVGPSTAGALGPMQFMPSTWSLWGITAFGEKGAPNVMDPYDAVPSAARYLCAAGASKPGGLSGAIFAYNHANWYVQEVLGLAQQYAAQYG